MTIVFSLTASIEVKHQHSVLLSLYSCTATLNVNLLKDWNPLVWAGKTKHRIIKLEVPRPGRVNPGPFRNRTCLSVDVDSHLLSFHADLPHALFKSRWHALLCLASFLFLWQLTLSKTGHVTSAAEHHFLFTLAASSRGDPQIFITDGTTLAFARLLYSVLIFYSFLLCRNVNN